MDSTASTMPGAGAYVHTTPAVARTFGSTVTWGGWRVPIGVELGITFASGR